MIRVFYKYFALLLLASALLAVNALTVSCSNNKLFSSNKSSKLEQAIYHFYMGVAYNDERNSYDAMNELLKAETLCSDTDNNSLKGQICWYKGKIYSNMADYSNALIMFSNAAAYYNVAKVDEPLMYAYEQLAYVYRKTDNYKESLDYYNKAKEIALSLREKMLFSPYDSLVGFKQTNFNKLVLRYSSSIAKLYYYEFNNIDEAFLQLDSTYSKYNDAKINPLDYPFLSRLYLQKGNVVKADECLDSFLAYKNLKFGTDANSYKSLVDGLDGEDLLMVLGIKSDIEGKLNNYRDALYYKNLYINVSDSIAIDRRNKSVREFEQQFWKSQLEEENESIKLKDRYMTVIYFLLVLLMIVAVVAIFAAYREKLRTKNLLLAEYADAIDNLGERVNNAESSKKNLLGQLDIHKEKEKELKELLENRFSEVRELIRTYYEYGNSKKLQKKVDDLLKLQLSGDNFEVIEQVVNAKNNNVIKRVREKYPNLKEENIKLLSLIYAGFTAQEISVILSDTPQNIYVRKSRLKKSLQDLILSDSGVNFS